MLQCSIVFNLLSSVSSVTAHFLASSSFPYLRLSGGRLTPPLRVMTGWECGGSSAMGPDGVGGCGGVVVGLLEPVLSLMWYQSLQGQCC